MENNNDYDDSASKLVQQVNDLHNEMMEIYNREIKALKITVAVLQDQNKALKKRLEKYEG